MTDAPAPQNRLRFLIACHAVVFGGAYLRFERVGQVLRAWGHEVAWLLKPGAPAHGFPTSLPVLGPAEAARRTWDAVMVPGGGFDDETLAWLGMLHDRRYGLRVQHVLSESARVGSFEAVHAAFAPDLVVFNNVEWPAATMARLPAARQVTLPGAVDLVRFRPKPYRVHPSPGAPFVVGGQTRKNPEPLIEALRTLPPAIRLRLLGPDHHGLAEAHADLVEAGRLAFAGTLHDDDLVRFYDDVDAVVATETVAGWANFVAEAMASGVPVACTSHGTWSLARDGESALLIGEPTAPAIAAAVRRLAGEPALVTRLATAGRRTAEAFGWDAYARALAGMVARELDARPHLTDPAVSPGAALVAAEARAAEAEAREAEAAARAEAAEARARSAEARAEASAAHAAAAEAVAAAREHDLKTVLASTSWWLTGPARAAIRALRRSPPPSGPAPP